MTIQTNAGLSRLSNENHEQHETTREEEEHNILMQEEENTTTTNTKEEHWAPLHEDISELRIAEGVALEAKVYGDEDAPVQVVWGHGLGSSMTNEDKESLWNFWDVSERGDASSAGNGTATTTCDEDGSDGSASEEEEEVGLENLENLKDEKVRIVRYNARGHGYSSPAETSSQAKWENMAADMLKVANLKQQTRISKKTGKGKETKVNFRWRVYGCGGGAARRRATRGRLSRRHGVGHTADDLRTEEKTREKFKEEGVGRTAAAAEVEKAETDFRRRAGGSVRAESDGRIWHARRVVRGGFCRRGAIQFTSAGGDFQRRGESAVFALGVGLRR